MLAIPILLVILVLFAMGGAATAAATGSGFGSWINSVLKKASFIAGPLLSASIQLGKWLSHKYGEQFAAANAQVTKWFANLAHYQYVVGYWSLLWPVTLYHFGARLLGIEVPTAINARTKPLNKRVDAAEAAAKAAAGLAHSFPKVTKANSKVVEVTRIERVAMPHAGEWDWIHDHFGSLRKAVAGAAIAAGGLVLPRAPAWPHPWRGIKTELGKLWKFRNYVLSATGAAAIVAIGIGGVSGNCVKKGAIGKVARRLCGLSSHALNDLLGLLVDAFIITDVCAVVDVIGEAAKLVQQPLVEVVGGLEAALCHGDYSAPATLKPPHLYLPDTLSTQLYVV